MERQTAKNRSDISKVNDFENTDVGTGPKPPHDYLGLEKHCKYMHLKTLATPGPFARKGPFLYPEMAKIWPFLVPSAQVYVCICICICICIWICIWICVQIYIYVYIYIYMQPHRKTKAEKGKDKKEEETLKHEKNPPFRWGCFMAIFDYKTENFLRFLTQTCSPTEDIYIYIFIFIYPSISPYLPLFLSFCLSLSISTSLSIYLHLNPYLSTLSSPLSANLSPSISLSLSIMSPLSATHSLSLSLYIYIYISLSLCLSLSLSLYLSLFAKHSLSSPVVHEGAEHSQLEGTVLALPGP